MKPVHEQEWKVRNTNIGPVIDDMSGHPGGEAVCMVYAPMSYDGARLTLEQSDAIREERARFIAASPRMARALDAVAVFLKDIHEGSPTWHRRGRLEALLAEVDAARRDAGVLP